MGIKKHLKSNCKKCFCCLKEFTEYEDKNIHRIDPKDNFKMSNMVVLCKKCKIFYSQGNTKIYETYHFIDNLKEYFKSVGIKKMDYLIIKMIKTREKYGKTVKFREK